MPAPIRRVDDLGFPMPGSFDELTDQPSRPKRTWGQFFYKYRWAVLLLLLPLLFGGSLINGARQFVAQRLLSNAEAQFKRDQLPEALASANRALFWEPDSFDQWQAYLCCADISEELPAGLKDSLDDLNEVIKRLDDPARSKQYSVELCEAYGKRAWVFERLGRHGEALADSTTAVKLASSLRFAPEGLHAEFLNQRAYIRALGGTELDQALQDVQQSLNTLPDDPNIIDTRGYIYFRLGKYDTALRDLEQAIRRQMSPPRPFALLGDNRLMRMPPPSELDKRKDREALAVMFHHRGEIRKKLGDEADGDGDIQRGERMGYNRERGVY